MITESSKGGGIGEVAQANRIPLALIGIGVAWLVAANTGLTERVARDARVQTARRRIGEIAGEIGIGGSSAPEKNNGRAGPILGPDGEPLTRGGDAAHGDGWVHQAAGAARGAISSVRDAGSAVLDRASKYTEYAGEYAGGYAGDAGDLAKRAGKQIAEKLQHDPWLIGVVGLVAGALLAAMLPPTRIEQDYIGEARDELWNQAQELGHEAAERIRELADSATRDTTH
ncbi:MAG TPA: hypothetical protein VKF83_10885 [Stellaceae bacterium]|nr:hypothetical protein [Stellaceae bacterium]